ncbi:hypothetical protein Tco_0523433 [Tanacetum coccineum]
MNSEVNGSDVGVGLPPEELENPSNRVMQKEDGIFFSQNKYVDEILKKFGCSTVRIANTPMKTSKPLLKDIEDEDVDVHLYRSMIGSLIIFRYLKGQPKLGLWYPKDSPFDLEAYSDSDYAGASLDRKSITGVFLDKQVEGMTKHKEIYVTPSHTKKVFANMKRERKDFSRRVTPLFQTMMVQAPKELGEGSEIPTDPQHTPTIIQPSTSQPQKKLPKRKQRKDTKGEEMLILMDNAEVTLVDEAQGRIDDNLMFDTGVFDEQEVEVEKAVSTAEVTTISATTTTVDELTMAQTLIKIKAAKPKAVTTATTTTIIVVTRPKARVVVVQEPSELENNNHLHNITFSIGYRLKTKDNTQAMMEANYELAQRLQAEEQGELTIEERSKLFVELIDKRKKHFAKLRAEEIRRKPPTKAQKRN